MLRNTFSHIPGIGTRMEEKLWESGLLSWNDCLATPATGFPCGRRTAERLLEEVRASERELENGNALHFAERLPSDQHWRLFPEFRHSTVYLDIETTGLGPPSDHITTIALYDGRHITTYVWGENMERFAEDVARYALVVTYNGKCFDLPFIRDCLRISMPHAHIDLRYVLKSLGHGGGLKACERRFGLDREELDGVDGFFAVLLWQEYRRTGDRRVLETLLAYNILDVVNLETLMIQAYNLKVGTTRLGLPLGIPPASAPTPPFSPDRRVIERVRRVAERYSWS